MDAATDRRLQEVLGGFQGLRVLAQATQALHDAAWGMLPEKTEAALREHVDGLLKTQAEGLAEQVDALDYALIEARQVEREAAA